MVSFLSLFFGLFFGDYEDIRLDESGFRFGECIREARM